MVRISSAQGSSIHSTGIKLAAVQNGQPSALEQFFQDYTVSKGGVAKSALNTKVISNLSADTDLLFLGTTAHCENDVNNVKAAWITKESNAATLTSQRISDGGDKHIAPLAAYIGKMQSTVPNQLYFNIAYKKDYDAASMALQNGFNTIVSGIYKQYQSTTLSSLFNPSSMSIYDTVPIIDPESGNRANYLLVGDNTNKMLFFIQANGDSSGASDQLTPS